jgi:hypothetical protein
VLRGNEAVEAAGLEPLSQAEWRRIFDRSIRPLPGREAQEGGGVFSIPRFLEELKKATSN